MESNKDAPGPRWPHEGRRDAKCCTVPSTVCVSLGPARRVFILEKAASTRLTPHPSAPPASERAPATHGRPPSQRLVPPCARVTRTPVPVRPRRRSAPERRRPLADPPSQTVLWRTAMRRAAPRRELRQSSCRSAKAALRGSKAPLALDSSPSSSCLSELPWEETIHASTAQSVRTRAFTGTRQTARLRARVDGALEKRLDGADATSRASTARFTPLDVPAFPPLGASRARSGGGGRPPSTSR